jgi:membrane protein
LKISRTNEQAPKDFVEGSRQLGGDLRRASSPEESQERPISGEAGSVAMRELGRGREANTPSAIPAKGWKDIFWRTFARFSDHRILLVAAGVTFYTLLAIFPGIAALISLYGLFADPGAISNQLGNLTGILPGGAVDIIRGEMTRLAAQKAGSLGFGFFSGVGVALWSASGGLKALFNALNIVYDEKEKRGFVKLAALALLFTLGSAVFLLIALGTVIVLPIVLNFIGLGGLSELLIKTLRWPGLFVLTGLALAFLYRYGPCRTKAEWRWITWGSALAAILWVVASVLFSLYVQNFGNYNKTYGSLGAVIGFMTWIWVSTSIFLLGAELNAEIEHQTARDTTTGRDKPLDARVVTVADTIGNASD